MAKICVKIIDKNGNILADKCDEREVNLVYRGVYQEGDYIEIEAEKYHTQYYVQLDDAKGKSLVYLTGKMQYVIPFGEKRVNISPKVFSGDRHVLSVRQAMTEEKDNYRNLSENVWDQHGNTNCYPHASANVETRGESVFAALNAIDGVTVSESHGAWPYESWGINQRADAVWRLEFGRPIEMDKIVFYTRADFPHDNWWQQLTVTFSDGGKQVVHLQKGGFAQEFAIEKKEILWLEIGELIKSDEPSPFPALTQLQVYGRG